MRSEGGLSALAKTHGKRFCNDVQSTKRSTNSHRIERFLVQLKRTSTICAYLRFLVRRVSSMFKQFFALGTASCPRHRHQTFIILCPVFFGIAHLWFIIPYYWCSVLPKNAGHYSVLKISRYLTSTLWLSVATVQHFSNSSSSSSKNIHCHACRPCLDAWAIFFSFTSCSALESSSKMWAIGLLQSQVDTFRSKYLVCT